MVEILRSLEEGGIMFDPAVLERYRNMSSDEKIKALTVIIHLDEKPLGTLLAMLAVLEPDRVEGIFERLCSLVS